jgi:putative ABC transport system permease protein
MNGNILRLAAASLWSRKVSAILTVIAVAVSVLLFAGVEKLRTGAREGFEQTISGTHLIVGARSSPINLTLYSVFRIGDATNNISWGSYQAVASRPDVAWTIPISLGDSHRGYRVIGTSGDYFRHYQYGGGRNLTFAQGRAFDDLFDVVLGAEVARALDYGLGDTLTLSHGIGEVSFSEHADKPFTIVGILAPTGTPVDRSLHVSLEAIEAIHVGWQSGAPTPMARGATAERVRNMTLAPKEITAFFLGAQPPTAALGLQRQINTYRGEPLQAVIPGIALAQLWQVVGVAERALMAVSAFVVIVGLVGILTSILTSLNERRREMAILRAIGARAREIFTLLLAEAALLAAVGAGLGLCLLYGLMSVFGGLIEARLGVALGAIGPGLFDLQLVGAITGLAILMGLLPALQAMRSSLADGLSIRM